MERIEVETGTGLYQVWVQHGTAGMGESFGFARVEEWEGEEMKSWRNRDQTQTVLGPFTHEEAERECAVINDAADEYARTH